MVDSCYLLFERETSELFKEGPFQLKKVRVNPVFREHFLQESLSSSYVIFLQRFGYLLSRNLGQTAQNKLTGGGEPPFAFSLRKRKPLSFCLWLHYIDWEDMSVLSNKAASSPVISAGPVSLQMVSFQCCL